MKYEPRWAILMVKPLETASVDRASTRVGLTMLIQVDGDSDMVATSWPFGGGFGKGTLASTGTSAWRKAAHPARAKRPDHSFSSLYASGAFQVAVPTLEL